MTQELIAIIEGQEMGRVSRGDTGKLSFTYNEQWRNDPDAYPLSISMPLPLSEHVSAVKSRMTGEGFAHPLIGRLADSLAARSVACRKILHSA
jgi:HipA-like protein